MKIPGVSAVILVGPCGETEPERLVYRARTAATRDLIAALKHAGAVPVIVAATEFDWLPASVDVVRDVDTGPFHFGERLADLIETYDLSPVIYFGAGSAPLMDQELLDLLTGMLLAAEFGSGGGIPDHIALTNNRHSSDWIGLSQARDALSIIRAAPRDNSLAWMLQQDRRYDVRVLAGMRPASSLDLDTPAELSLVRHHTLCGPDLRTALKHPLLQRIPFENVLDVLRTDGQRVALLGRVAPVGWQALNKVTRVWMRVFSEERGMAANERLARGEVQSLVGVLVDMLGPDAFFATLADMADAALIDSRVLMAANGHYPGAADRYASDLFLVDTIQDIWVKDFTQAAANATIPVVLGGHSVVAGGLHVLAEVLSGRGVGVND